MKPATKKPHVSLYDTTLRDGCQGEDVSLTLADKLRVAERLDELGFDYIEGGWPGSNPRDEEFFREVKKLKLRHARIAAFGMTRRAGIGGSRRPQLAEADRSRDPGDHHLRQDLAAPRARGSADLRANRISR